MNKIPVVIVPGNGYSYRRMHKFIKYLDKQSWCEYVVYIELLENLFDDISYEKLKPENYSKYIYDRLPEKDKKYIFYGTSMGCYHIQNYASIYGDTIHSIIWMEPTMCGGDYKLLRDFEEGRGNGKWLKELYDIPYDLNELPSNEKVIDIAVSNDLNNDFDVNIPLGIIYAFYRNDGECYNSTQLRAKDGFLKELEEKGHKIEFMELDGPHSADVYEEFIPEIVKFIVNVSFYFIIIFFYLWRCSIYYTIIWGDTE